MAKEQNTPSRRAVLGGLVVATTAPAAGAASLADASDPDAELIRLCNQHILNTRAYNSYKGKEEDADDLRLWAAYCATDDAVSAAIPKTLAGVTAKARAALEDASQRVTWGEAILRDIVRIAGGAY